MKTGGQFLTERIGDRIVFCPEQFSEEQLEFAALAESFALEELLPRKKEIEQLDKELSVGLIRKCGELGLLAADAPEAYGGLDQDKVTAALLVEKITASQSQSFMVTFSVQTGIGLLPIVYFGSDEQKEFYIPKISSGEMISAYALTEPGSGSDALSIRTTAVPDQSGENYILNGTKQFISNGAWADILITFAKIDGEQLTGFLIDPKSDGITIHEEKNKLGLHGSSTCNITLENVKVPAENILGKIGHGAEIAFNTLNIGRFKLGAAVLGGCKNTILESVKYALERKQFGQSIAYFDAIMKKIADMTIRTYALESIVYETAGLLDETIQSVDTSSDSYHRNVADAIERIAVECSICKIYGSEAMGLNSDEGLQILGGYGYIEDYPFAQMVRDARVDRIYEGTNEINRQIIIGYLLKKTLLEELPIREHINRLSNSPSKQIPKFKKELYPREKTSIEIFKRMFFFVFNEVLIQYGQDLITEQQVGELLCDALMDIFILNTTICRMDQNAEAQQSNPVTEAAVAILLAEKGTDIYNYLTRALSSTVPPRELAEKLNTLDKLYLKGRYLADTAHLKQDIARHIIKEKKYKI